jgi:mannose/fructose/N-acetylgalactosamine-specific phosphotransferase system component IIB
MSLPWEGRHDYAKSSPVQKKKEFIAQPIWFKHVDVKESIRTIKKPKPASGRALAARNSDIKVINLVTGEVTVTKNNVTAPGNKKRSR